VVCHAAVSGSLYFLPMGESAHLVAGSRALAEGKWIEARNAFEAALAAGESAEALSGLGEALFYQGDLTRAVELRERAYVAFRNVGDAAGAARMALWLAMPHAAGFSNAVVASGWVGRAERLLDGLETCAEHGWLILRRSRGAANAAEAEQLALEALSVAHAVDDADLEIAAISQRGRALLACGRIEEGFACLDEAMAAATSGEVRLDTVGGTCCDMIGACERTAGGMQSASCTRRSAATTRRSRCSATWPSRSLPSCGSSKGVTRRPRNCVASTPRSLAARGPSRCCTSPAATRPPPRAFCARG
jgi:hypothetical protein